MVPRIQKPFDATYATSYHETCAFQGHRLTFMDTKVPDRQLLARTSE
jgi:hypothetical protein